MKPVELGAYYESILEKEVRKEGGVYYTPQYIVDYIVEHTVGKMFAEIKINIINDFPTPFGKTASLSQKKLCYRLVDLVEQMLTVQKRLHGIPKDLSRDLNRKRVAIISDKIDAVVYQLYGLTDDEIAIVEGNSGSRKTSERTTNRFSTRKHARKAAGIIHRNTLWTILSNIPLENF
jgi:hypothetical protein